MGLLAPSQPKVKSTGGKLAELKRKLDQLQGTGMVHAKERIERQIRRLERVAETPEKVKPLSPQEMKKQIQGAKATGQAK